MEWKLSAGVLEGMTELKPNCVECNGNNTALIFWGYPGDMDWYLNAVDEKKIVPGGCMIGNNDPKWECNDCHNRWGTREEDEDK